MKPRSYIGKNTNILGAIINNLCILIDIIHLE